MTSQDIQQKVAELRSIMSQYKHELGGLEKELYRAISDYQKALEEEKLKEIRDSLS
jgi:hypothetical protein